jgi:hypothetical protein
MNITGLKNDAMKYPEPLKSMIMSEADVIEDQEFVSKFLMWRKLARSMDIQITVVR